MAQLHSNLNQLPAYLYRVQHGDSRATLSPIGDLEAEDTTSYFDNEEQFRLAILDSFTWSCFIKLFSDKQYAERWALKRHRMTGKECQVITIDTSALIEGRVFRLADLVDGLELEIPAGAGRHVQRVYLCFRRIPAEAMICNRRTLPSRKNVRIVLNTTQRDLAPAGWCMELEGYRSADNEVGRSNLSDDIFNTSK